MCAAFARILEDKISAHGVADERDAFQIEFLSEMTHDLANIA